MGRKTGKGGGGQLLQSVSVRYNVFGVTLSFSLVSKSVSPKYFFYLD